MVQTTFNLLKAHYRWPARKVMVIVATLHDSRWQLDVSATQCDQWSVNVNEHSLHNVEYNCVDPRDCAAEVTL